jgi:WD40 repeat protein/Flp pilus assembly protein TadD
MSDTLPVQPSRAGKSPGVQTLLVDQQSRWQRGERASVEDYLARQPDLQNDPEALLDLITHEVLLRRQAREKPQLEEYQRRFPRLAEALARQFEVEGAIDDATLFHPDALSPATIVGDERASWSNHLAPPNVAGYEILGELGRGAMGVVYKARHRQLNRVVALKMILSGGFASPQERVRFLAEAEAIAAIEHPGIVRVHEFGTHDGLPFFSLEFCAGGTLASTLAGTPLPPQQSARLVEQLARAVQAAHDRGIVHRDLKPGNVLLQKDEGGRMKDERGRDSSDASFILHPLSFVPKITDFGLAKRVESSGLTTTGAVVGTPSYMAPEQAMGNKDVGKEADIYALGAILYDCMTGRPPFKAARVYDTLMQVIGDEPVPPRQLNAQLPRDLETICLKCLHKRPSQRYASAGELADDLARWQRGEPVQARPVGTSERFMKWARRRPAVAGLLASIVLLTATALAVITGLYRNAALEAKRAGEAEKQAETDRDSARAELERAERLVYANQVQAARREWEANNPSMAWQHLRSCRWDYRDVEYRFLFTLFNRNHVTLHGHAGTVHGVAISGDGKRIVSCSEDRTLKVWDADTGKELLSLSGHAGEVRRMAISGDGKRIVSGSEDKTVKVWDAASGKELLTLSGHASDVLGVAISPDGRRIASGSWDRTVKVWDAASGKELLTLQGHSAGVISVAISPDSRRIVSASADKTLKVWDADTGKELLTLSGHSNGVLTVAISPDGRRIVSGSVDRTVKVWDAESGKELLDLKGHAWNVITVAISGDGRRIVSASGDGRVMLWNATTGEALLTLQGHTLGVFCAAISNDGRRIVSGSEDRTIKVWDASARRDRVTPKSSAELSLAPTPTRLDTAARKDHLTLEGHGNGVLGVAIDHDGRRIVSASQDRTLKVWDAASGRELLTLAAHAGQVLGVAFSPDGKRIVSGSADKTVKVWDADTGKELLTLEGHADKVAGVAFDGGGHRIVSGSLDKAVKVWDSSSGKEVLTLKGHSAGVTSVAISPDGRRVVSGSEDKTLKIWDAVTGEELFTLSGHTRDVLCVAFSRDGRRVVSGSKDNTARTWDAASGKELLTLVGHPGEVSCAVFCDDDRRIISGSWAPTLKVWDTASGQELLTLEGHADRVNAVALSRDSKYIVSGSQDRTVKVWDTASGQDLLVLDGHPGGGETSRDVASVAIGGDGKRIFAKAASSRIFAWSAVTGKLLPDAPPEMPPGSGREAATADGSLRVNIEHGRIRVYCSDLEKERQLREARDRALLHRLSHFDVDWHRQQLDEALAARDDFAAAIHVERLLRGQPWDAGVHVLATHALARLGRRQEAATHLAQALMLNPHVSLRPIDPAANQRGEQAAEAGEWPLAVQHFQIAAYEPGASAIYLNSLLLSQLAMSDEEGVRQTLREITRRLAGEKDPKTIDLVTFFARFAPWDEAAAEVLLAHVKGALDRQRNTDTLREYGVALYRAGRYDEAEHVLAESVKAHGKGGHVSTRLFQAMTARRRGKYEEAAQSLASFEQWHGKQKFESWRVRVGWSTLLAEARKVIQAPPIMSKAAAD